MQNNFSVINHFGCYGNQGFHPGVSTFQVEFWSNSSGQKVSLYFLELVQTNLQQLRNYISSSSSAKQLFNFMSGNQFQINFFSVGKNKT